MNGEHLMISVVIPTHNRASGLIRAVRSVYDQTELPDELIIVDDGSKYPVTKDIFFEAPKSLACTLLRNTTPRGANQARNRGINHAKSDWIMFLDDDDQFLPTKVQVINSQIQHSGKNLDVISHGAQIIMPELRLSYIANTGYGCDLDLKCELLLRNVIGSTSFVTIKKSSAISVGLFWQELPALQDNELWLRLAIWGGKFLYIDEALTIYDQSINSKSITKSDVNYHQAYQMISQRYQHNYAHLCQDDQKRLKLYRLKSRVHRALLTGNNKAALITQLKIFRIQPRLSNMIMIFLCFAGRTVVYKARARLGKTRS